MNTLVLRWYFGKIKRIEAEKKLLQADNEHGSFLVRDSESRHHDFSLSSKYLVEGISSETRSDTFEAWSKQCRAINAVSNALIESIVIHKCIVAYNIHIIDIGGIT